MGGKTAVPEERTDVLVGLEEYCREVGIELDEAAADGMRAYWRMVLAANERMNLTRITGDLDAVLKHFVDSLTVLLTGLFSVGARVVDVGTGAGFPGVPLKLARPDLRVVLVDATLKRVRFLETVIGHFGWRDVQAVHARAEMLARDPETAGTFDVAVARAVASLDKVVTWSVPLVRPGGHLVAMKGPEVEDELAGAERALRRMGARVADVRRLALPREAGRRTLVVVRREP
nr:16S rRNA (guanine(527)-N(7))-methyltransferase RsmG [Bacillota bacterium]